MSLWGGFQKDVVQREYLLDEKPTRWILDIERAIATIDRKILNVGRALRFDKSWLMIVQ